MNHERLEREAPRVGVLQVSDELDARRYRALRSIYERTVGSYLTASKDANDLNRDEAVELRVNDQHLVYEENGEGKAYELHVYPNTPIGFYEVYGNTLDEITDQLIANPSLFGSLP